MPGSRESEAGSPRKPVSWASALLGVAVIIVGAYLSKNNGRTAAATKPVAPATEATGDAVAKTGNYETYRNCTLVAAPHNDGDSFMVRLPTGKQAEFRLYFVDTPESAFKTYGGGETNHERIEQQARDLGGIRPEQAVEIGKKAKEFILDLLASHPFTLHTVWDSPYHDDRFHAFVEVKDGARSVWLHELLVEKGFVRIYTKGADLPDGTPLARHKDHLKELERAAKAGRRGVWGL